MAQTAVNHETTNELIAFTEPIEQSRLDIDAKDRSNLFNWRGQFSPQLVEELLSAYCPEGAHVLDPFVGSGSVLYESALMGFQATGFEINPAAAILAKTYEYSCLPEAIRSNVVSEIDDLLQSRFPRDLPLFGERRNGSSMGEEEASDVYTALLEQATSNQRPALDTLTLTLNLGDKELTTEKIWKCWNDLRELILSLPESRKSIRVFLSDARDLGLEDNSVDFVITSPPYINVFNYHQNYRKPVEALGWDVLRAARSEIGSNRKFRRNRYLTVAQYCMDMALCLEELARVCHSESRIIFVVGKESNVLRTPFYNGRIVSEIAERCNLFEIALTQKRVFKNKFGKDIWEDIIHFKPKSDTRSEDIVEAARKVGVEALEDALDRVPDKSLENLESAIQEAKDISPSNFFSPAKQEVKLSSVLNSKSYNQQ